MQSSCSETSLLTASMLATHIDGFPETVICTWQKPVENRLKKCFATSVAGHLVLGPVSEIFSFECSGRKLGFVLLPVGSPATVMAMEEMKVKGAVRFVFTGSCGVLSDNVRTKFIVPDSAYIDEGTSVHYSNEQSSAVVSSTWNVTDAFLSERNIPHLCGSVWTTDTPYRETSSAVECARTMGCVAVDMESSAIMTVSEALGVKSYQMLFTADFFSSDGWNKGALRKNDPLMWDKLVEIVTDFSVYLDCGNL